MVSPMTHFTGQSMRNPRSGRRRADAVKYPKILSYLLGAIPCLRVGKWFGNVVIMNFAPSKLFHAVVISGAALTGCASTAQKPQTAGDANAAANPATSTPQSSAGVCPPGSERPYPPCYWIK
jgi:hypothetical protein